MPLYSLSFLELPLWYLQTVLDENKGSHGFVDFEPFNLLVPLKSHLSKLSRNDINVYEHETYMLCLHFVITSAIKSTIDMCKCM